MQHHRVPEAYPLLVFHIFVSMRIGLLSAMIFFRSLEEEEGEEEGDAPGKELSPENSEMESIRGERFVGQKPNPINFAIQDGCPIADCSASIERGDSTANPGIVAEDVIRIGRKINHQIHCCRGSKAKKQKEKEKKEDNFHRRSRDANLEANDPESVCGDRGKFAHKQDSAEGNVWQRFEH
ncbi:hypothetical protein CAPTEDRAFT_214994 [Capitella teleta]|uniref:Uncharacterized protein n=1 Tax=Capitella teleta TaxID=283909 RepID=R7TEH9_CAPTE|nr:hypothetical protein CAPTEDRAFT_214994 [Capitella teleta]|eukprot:ELT92134.1 hypothetical protein CAPTEDRAFT_214994 [Capitella teleta]